MKTNCNQTEDVNIINFLLFLALMILTTIPVASSEENAVNYWTIEGNKHFDKNETTKAEECYDYAIYLDSIKQ
ncbi:MAG: hypothetical protein QG575_920, partial [Euryarchaeota archaeon]|nr:hypothetical protein [Euryarchaeota archaeon]